MLHFRVVTTNHLGKASGGDAQAILEDVLHNISYYDDDDDDDDDDEYYYYYSDEDDDDYDYPAARPVRRAQVLSHPPGVRVAPAAHGLKPPRPPRQFLRHRDQANRYIRVGTRCRPSIQKKHVTNFWMLGLISEGARHAFAGERKKTCSRSPGTR